MIIGPSEDSARLAALRLEIEGSWSVDEFQGIMLTLSDVYRRVATTVMLGNLVREEQQRNELLNRQERNEEQGWTWHMMYYGPLHNFEREQYLPY